MVQRWASKQAFRKKCRVHRQSVGAAHRLSRCGRWSGKYPPCIARVEWTMSSPLLLNQCPGRVRSPLIMNQCSGRVRSPLFTNQMPGSSTLPVPHEAMPQVEWMVSSLQDVAVDKRQSGWQRRVRMKRKLGSSGM